MQHNDPPYSKPASSDAPDTKASTSNTQNHQPNHPPESRCGFVAIMGRPNVGKSTLLNRLCGRKLSIISRKPQTTRHKILAVKTSADKQTIYVDTPGLHRKPKHRINRLMIKAALSALADVDAVMLVISAQGMTEDETAIFKRLARVKAPIILVINKIDKIKNKAELLPLIEQVNEQLANVGIQPHSILPLSAKQNDGLEQLEQTLEPLLPISPFMYPKEQLTDRSERFLAAEVIREKLMRFLGDEVPHSTSVEIEEFQPKKSLLKISAIIWVERKGQKNIVIGSKGDGLKNIGQLARLDLEKQFGSKILLKLWVKVKAGWTDDLKALNSLGYGDF